MISLLPSFFDTFIILVMLRPLLFTLLLLLVLPQTACQTPEPPEPAVEVKVYEGGVGRVKDIVADGHMAIVTHDEIPGFMLGMTMTFGLREDSVRGAMAVGDSISFDVSFDGIDSWISRVTVIE